MGNALQSVSKAVDAKFIGGNPLESKFAAIDKGIKDVKAWKDNIDKQRLELKQNTAKQIREAEKYAFENMPNSETAKTRVLADLAKYKDQMLMNERLVRNGSISPEENLIFFENGKQTFEIYADMVNNFDKELTLTEQRAKGYYKENDDGTKTFVPPVAGELEAIKQQIQTQIGTLSGIETNFTEKGMGDVTFFQMEVDPVTNTYREKRDAQGNKIPLQGTQPNMSVLALSHKANTRSDRRYLSNEVDEFSNQTSLTYDTMFDQGMMVGNVVTDARNNPELATLIENKTAALTTDIDAVASYFGKDNGFGGQLVSFTQWDNLTDEQKNETITVTILDENLNEKQITYKKYAKVAAANSNNAIVPELDENQIAAAQGHVRQSLVAGLQRKITKGAKRTEFDPLRSNKIALEKGAISSVDLFEVVEKSYGGTAEEVRQSTENLMIRSGYKFEDTSPKKVKDARGNEILVAQTYSVDKGDGAGSSSFELTTMVENPEWTKLSEGQKAKQKVLKKGSEEYIEQYVPVSREEYENKMYELFKKKGDTLSVSEARDQYSQNNSSYDRNKNTFNTDADRSISVTTSGTLDITAIPAVSVNTKIGSKSAIEGLYDSQAFKRIDENWTDAGVKGDTNQLNALQGELQGTFDAIAAEQGGGQGSGVKIKYDKSSAKFYAVGPNGKRTSSVSVAVDSDKLESVVKSILANAISEFLPSREASQQQYTCDGGFLVLNGSRTRKRCPK